MLLPSLPLLLALALQDPAAPSPLHPLELGAAPSFSLPSLNEPRLVTTADFPGKLVLIDIWRSDCPRCQRDAEYLVALRKKYFDRGLEILGVSDENRDPRTSPIATAIQFAKDRGFEFPLALSDGGEFHAGYYQRVLGTPSAYLIRRNGELEFLGLDPMRPEMRATLEALIEKRLDEPESGAALRAPVPHTLPDFTLVSLRGGALRSSDLRGKPAVIALLLPSLSTRYGPTLSALATQYGPLGLRVIGVVFGSFRDVLADIDARTPVYEVALPDPDAQRALVGADYLPKFLFVSADGTVLKTITNVYGRERGIEPFVLDRYASLLVGAAASRPTPIEASASRAKPAFQHGELGFAIDPPAGYRESRALDGARARFLGTGSQELRVVLESRYGSNAAAAERITELLAEGLERRRVESREWRDEGGQRALLVRESWDSPLGSIRAFRALVPCADGVYVVTASAPQADYGRDGAELEKSALSFRVKS